MGIDWSSGTDRYIGMFGTDWFILMNRLGQRLWKHGQFRQWFWEQTGLWRKIGRDFSNGYLGRYFGNRLRFWG